MVSLFKYQLAAKIRAASEDQDFVLWGSGFVDFAPGRVFVPWFGSLRWVPSAEEERKMNQAAPTFKQVLLFGFAIVVAGSILWRVLSVPDEIRAHWLSTVFLFGALLWCWRQIALTRHWPAVDRSEVTRTKVALTNLQTLPAIPMVLQLVIMTGVAFWLMWALGNLPTLLNPETWISLPIFVVLILNLLRSSYWRGLALRQRIRHRLA